MSILGTLHTLVHQSVWLCPTHTQGLVPSVFTHLFFCYRLIGSEVELIPTPVCRLYHSVCLLPFITAAVHDYPLQTPQCTTSSHL